MKISKPNAKHVHFGTTKTPCDIFVDMNKPFKYNQKVLKTAVTQPVEIFKVTYEDNIQDLLYADILMNNFLRDCANIPVITKYGDTIYLLNETRNVNVTNMVDTTITDTQVSETYEKYGENWKEYQASIMDKFRAIFPVSSKNDYKNAPAHKELATDPKRGLDLDDIKEFMSWKAYKTVNPALFQTDFIGLPGLKHNTVSVDVAGKEYIFRQVHTLGPSGLMIPMPTPKGHIVRHQIMTDLKPNNTILKARAVDGISIAKDQFFNKNTKEYTLNLDGQPSHLKAIAVDDGNIVTFEDYKGTFTVKEKQDVLELLKERGYEIPELMHSLKVQNAGKYTWNAPGNGIGSVMAEVVAAPDPGFLIAKEPQNGNTEYDLLIVEGALKGHIVAKYIDKQPDSNRSSVAEVMSKDYGVIVVQIPGVAQKFLEKIAPIFEEKPIRAAYIAMDADGRTNLNVARGIHKAQEILGQLVQKDTNGQPMMKVMSWNEELKGLDDMLLAYARKEVSPKDLKLRFNTAEVLFPLENATPPNPYNLDGTRKNKPSYMLEMDEARREKQDAMVQRLKEQTDDSQFTLLDHLDNTAPTLEP